MKIFAISIGDRPLRKNFRSENIEVLYWKGEGTKITGAIALAMA